MLQGFLSLLLHLQIFFLNVTLLGFVQLNPPVFDESVAADLWVGGACTCWLVASSARFKKTM